MSIDVTCSCGRRYRVADEAAGKRVRCRSCGKAIRVEVPTESVEDWEADISTFHERFQIDLDACPASRSGLGDKYLSAFRTAIVEYLEQSPETFQDAQIALTMRTKSRKKETVVQLRLSGTINGRPLDALLKRPVKVYRGGGGLLGATFLAASKIIDAAERAAAGNPNLVPEMQGTCKQLLVDLFQAVDDAAGRSKSSTAASWTTWQIAAVVAAACAFGGGILLLRSTGASIGRAVILSLFLTPLCFFFVISLGIATMPESFFKKEATGRRVMRFSGANSPGGARIVAAIAAAVMFALIIGHVALSMSLVKEKLDRPPRRTAR